MTQTPQQIADYLARCRRIQELYSYDYANTELENLMLSPQWDAVHNQLGKDERRAVRGYLNYIQDTSFGYLDTQIQTIETVTERVKQLHHLELNARWVVCDRRTGLYWSRIIEKPYWDKKSKAFLFTESVAEKWAKKFCKITSWWKFQAIKIDASNRLKKSKF